MRRSSGRIDPGPAPFAVGLGRLVTGHVAVKPQYVHDDVFGHHRIAAGGLDLAERGLWQSWMVDEGFDPGRPAEHRLQIRQIGKDVEIGTDEGEIFDIRHRSGVGPNADFKLGQPRREIVAPRLRIADLLVEIDG